MFRNITTLSLVTAICISPMTTAYGANKKFTEAEACNLAKAEVLNRQGGEKKVELNVKGCDKFTVFEQGVANIKVVYDTSYYNDYMKARYETKNLADTCSFIKASEGWQLTRCK